MLELSNVYTPPISPMTLKIIAEILLAIFTTIALSQVSNHIQLPKWKGWAAILLFLVISLNIIWRFKPEETEVKIVQPYSQQKVSQKIDIEGSYKNFADVDHLWVYIYAPNVHKYYLEEVTDRYNDGRWELKKVIIGTKRNQGISFKMGALVLKDRVHEDLKNGSHSLSDLPLGRKFNEISIERI
jgi:hypothetical protein